MKILRSFDGFQIIKNNIVSLKGWKGVVMQRKAPVTIKQDILYFSALISDN
jgi:hypothetical protein